VGQALRLRRPLRPPFRRVNIVSEGARAPVRSKFLPHAWKAANPGGSRLSAGSERRSSGLSITSYPAAQAN